MFGYRHIYSNTERFITTVLLYIQRIALILANLIPTTASIAGGFFIGILLGYFAKKVIRILMFVAGGIVGLLLYLQQQQIISVDQGRLEGSLTLVLTNLFSSFDKMTQVGDLTSIGIPLTASIAAGFTVALVKS
jgi:uncharacterized membrane protein (Fun14 family)